MNNYSRGIAPATVFLLATRRNFFRNGKRVNYERLCDNLHGAVSFIMFAVVFYRHLKGISFFTKNFKAAYPQKKPRMFSITSSTSAERPIKY